MIKDAYAGPQFFPKRKKRFVPFQEIIGVQALLKDTILTLSKEDQMILALRYQEGLSLEEIGEVLSRAPEEIENKFREVMGLIRKELNILMTGLN